MTQMVPAYAGMGWTEHVGEDAVWGFRMRGLALTPGPSPAPLDPPQAGVVGEG
jgi:hypothetical protein